MGRKSLGKGLGALINNGQSEVINSSDETDDENSETKLESVSDSKTDIKWDSPEETQKLEVYETTLTKAWQDGVITVDEEQIIEGIKNTLGITDAEHHEIETQVIAQQEIMKSVAERVAEAEAEPEPERGEEFETEYKNCPKCKHKIEVEYSEEKKIKLQCPECGAKGKIPNPYLKKKKELERKIGGEEESEPEAESTRGGEVESKNVLEEDSGEVLVKEESEVVVEEESLSGLKAEGELKEDVKIDKAVVEEPVLEEIPVEETPVLDERKEEEEKKEEKVKAEATIEERAEGIKEEEEKVPTDIDKRLEEKKKQFTMGLKLRKSEGRPSGPRREIEELPVHPEPTLPQAVRTGDDEIHEMVFMCPHCEAPFRATPTEDPQDIPCPTCQKDIKIIKPITFQCPLCSKEFPSVIQGESRILNCPYCSEEIELRK